MPSLHLRRYKITVVGTELFVDLLEGHYFTTFSSDGRSVVAHPRIAPSSRESGEVVSDP